VGAANLAAGLQDAWLGRSPVIALTGRKPPAYQHRNAYQEIPHGPLYAPVTKFTAEVDQAGDLPRLLRQAWREATTGSPRPAHLDLNGHLAEIIENGAVGEPAGVDPALKLRLPPHRPTPADDEIGRAAAKLLAAKRVAIVAGAGATASGAGPNCWPWGRPWRRRLPPRWAAVAWFRHGTGCQLVALATMPPRRPTRSCTRPNWWYSWAATPATR
jgi:acetolactate synthase-1/2/3 large subunit